MIQKIKDQIKELEEQIKVIQSECCHPPSCVTKKYQGDIQDDYGGFISSGNYSCFCSLCEARWGEGVLQ